MFVRVSKLLQPASFYKLVRASVFGVKMAVHPVVMCGPSGTGKSTLLKKLMKEFDNCFAFSVSHTTRKPRPGEVNGKEYYFVTREEMLKAIENEEFVEYAEFSGNLYGTSKKVIEDISRSGRICILDIDLQGVENVKKTDLNPIYIFVKPPDTEALRSRLEGRGTETEDSISRRLKIAKGELEYEKIPGFFNHVLINNDLEVAYKELKSILREEIDAVLKCQRNSQ